LGNALSFQNNQDIGVHLMWDSTKHALMERSKKKNANQLLYRSPLRFAGELFIATYQL
jgi:hypothetical protein